ncbi:MAG: hypothetical protein VXY17_03220, partial [Verrucomicrobiota bacterium]|nr:hypothetical protein [Verrucomicrobiota bacterium]
QSQLRNAAAIVTAKTADAVVKTVGAAAKTVGAAAKAAIVTTVVPKKNQNPSHYVYVACLHLSTLTTTKRPQVVALFK